MIIFSLKILYETFLKTQVGSIEILLLFIYFTTNKLFIYLLNFLVEQKQCFKYSNKHWQQKNNYFLKN